jgi:hypothetical protein
VIVTPASGRRPIRAAAGPLFFRHLKGARGSIRRSSPRSGARRQQRQRVTLSVDRQARQVEVSPRTIGTSQVEDSVKVPAGERRARRGGAGRLPHDAPRNRGWKARHAHGRNDDGAPLTRPAALAGSPVFSDKDESGEHFDCGARQERFVIGRVRREPRERAQTARRDCSDDRYPARGGSGCAEWPDSRWTSPRRKARRAARDRGGAPRGCCR